MKKTILVMPLILTMGIHVSLAQPTRYFEFTTQCGHGNWQDTSFIAATDDPVVIDTVLTDLDKPYEERRFISGQIDYGDGGYNHNAGHWFLWHFIPGQWELTEMAIEVCDGCPYSDVDADTAYWIGVLGLFCPWSGKPSREVSAPVSVDMPGTENWIHVFPNPASDHIVIQRASFSLFTITLYNAAGQKIMNRSDFPGSELALPVLKDGLYFLYCGDGRHSSVIPIWIKN